MTQNKHSIPFDINKTSQQTRLLSQLRIMALYLIPLGFMISILAIINFYDAIAYPTISTNNPIDFLLLEPRVWVSIAGIIFLIFLINYRKLPHILIRSYYPQKILHYFELYPKIAQISPLVDIISRVHYIVDIHVKPKFQADGSLLAPRINHRRSINIQIASEVKINKTRKLKYYRESISTLTPILFLVVFSVILFSFMYVGVDIVTTITHSYDWSLYDVVNLAIIFVLIIWIFYLMNNSEQVYIKRCTKQVSLDLMKAYKHHIQKTAFKSQFILPILVFNHPISNDIINYVKSKDGQINGIYTITLIEETETGYKIIWTG